MTAPTAEPVVEVAPGTDAGEIRVRFLCIAVEGLDTADGRFISVDALTARPTPMTVLAQTRAAHGGQPPPAAYAVGRIDTVERVPGPDVVSAMTGEPFPDGTWVWRGTGTIDGDAMVEGRPIGELLRRRYLRFISADLVPSDFEMFDDGDPSTLNPDEPTRRAIVHKADLAGLTIIPVSAFGDCIIELLDDDPAPPAETEVDVAELGLAASAFPAWRSADVGDPVAVVAAAAGEEHTGGMVALMPDEASAAKLALTGDGAEPVEQLHVTLAYLGDDVSGMTADVRDELPAAVRTAIGESKGFPGIIRARAFAHTTFNADGGPDDDREPCAVYGIGDSELLAPLQRAVIGNLGDVDGLGLPKQHAPWVPHVTAAYGRTAADLTYLGSVVFDRLAIVLGPDWSYIPLGADDPTDDPQEADAMAAATPAPPVEDEVIEPGDGGLPDEPQPCQMGEHPAVRSLLFRDEDAYVPVCDEHEQEAREQLDEAGETVVRVVDIPQDGAEPADETGDEDPVTASAAAPLPVEDVYVDDIITASGDTHRRPPLEWFTNPGFTELTPITIDGPRVFGHIGSWDRKHLSFNGQDVRMPRTRCDYREFLRGGVRVDDNGTARVAAVGHLTFDTSHADGTLSVAAAARFYDHTGYSWARVAAGEDKFGVWVSGILRPGITDEQIDTALAHPPSGDWRSVDGALELVSVLCVSVPGFGVARSRVASGQMQTLVASSDLSSQRVPDSAGAVVLDYDTLADAIATRLDDRRAAGELSAAHASLMTELDDTPAVVAALLAEVDDTPAAVEALLAELDDERDDTSDEEVEAFLSRMPAQLQREWLYGAIAARIAWGTPGAWRRCVAIAREKDVPARMRPGMCQNLKSRAGG